MILADTFSCANIKDCTTLQTALEEELAYMIHKVLSNASFTNVKVEEVRKATSEDTTMRLLQAAIQNAWPDKISEAPAEVNL